MRPAEKLTVAGLGAALLFSLGVLVGVVTHGAPRDRRGPGDALVPVARTKAHDSQAGSPAAMGVPASPSESLTAVKEALARGDVGAADRAWRTAHAVVLRTSSWRGFAALGDSALRIGEKSDRRGAYVAHAREAYLAALTHARDQGSVEGVTRVWRAFTALGDYEVAAHCAIIAEKLQARLYATTVTSRSTRGGPGSRIDP